MEESATDSISYIIKNKKYPMLVCPKCKSCTIQIVSLSMGMISFKCICNPVNNTMPLKQFISSIKDIDSSNEKCFKHKENIANTFCPMCKLYMCDVCESYHESFQPEHQTTKQIVKMNDQCLVHKGLKKVFYCSKCDIDVCEKCKNSLHKVHINQVLTMEQYFDKCRPLVKFKSTEELSTAYLSIINDLLSYKERQINFLNSLTNIILSITDEINKKCAETLQKNYDNMLLTKIITDIYYSSNENNQIPNYSAVKNAITLVQETKQKIGFNGQMTTTFGGNINGTGTWQTNWGGANPGPAWGANKMSLNSNKQIQLENLLTSFKKEAEDYFTSHEIEYSTKRINYKKRVYIDQVQEVPFMVKKKALFIKQVNTESKIGKISNYLELKDGNIAVCTDDKKIKIINPMNFQIIGTLLGHNVVTASLCQLSNGNLLSGSSAGFGQLQNTSDSIKEWSLTTFESVRVISNFSGGICCLHQLKNGNVLIGSITSSTIFIVDIVTLEIKYSFCPSTTLSNIILVLDNSEFVVACSLFDYRTSRQYIKVWDIQKKEMYSEIERNFMVTNLHQLYGGRKLLILDAKSITIYNISRKETESQFNIVPAPNVAGQPNVAPPVGGGLINRGGAAIHTFGSTRTPLLNALKNNCMITNELIAIGGGKGIIEVFDITTFQKILTISNKSTLSLIDSIFKMKNGKIICASGMNIYELN